MARRVHSFEFVRCFHETGAGSCHLARDRVDRAQPFLGSFLAVVGTTIDQQLLFSTSRRYSGVARYLSFRSDANQCSVVSPSGSDDGNGVVPRIESGIVGGGGGVTRWSCSERPVRREAAVGTRCIWTMFVPFGSRVLPPSWAPSIYSRSLPSPIPQE